MCQIGQLPGGPTEISAFVRFLSAKVERHKAEILGLGLGGKTGQDQRRQYKGT